MSTGGSARPGVVMVDVARRAGVSQKTVSRVVNGAPHVRPEVRDRVLAVIGELGYRPNVAAQALVTQRTRVIGVLAVGLPAFAPTLRVLSLEHGARRRGYELAMASLPDMSSTGIRTALDSLLARGVEGIVLEVPNQLVDIDEAALRGVPVASSVGYIAGVRRQVVVDTLQADVGRLATEHLLALGHETVFHVAGPAEWEASRLRQEGWSAALAAAGRRQPEVLPGDWSAGSGYENGRRLAARLEVTAIFTANDSQAMGVMRAVTEAGRAVPADVSVVGVDDVPEAEFQMVPLTTVRSDQTAIADRVLSELVALIEGREPAPGAPLTVKLVIRSSTGPPGATRAGLPSDRPLPVKSSSHPTTKEGTNV